MAPRRPAKKTAKRNSRKAPPAKKPVMGRPSAWKPEFVELVFELALLGKTEPQIAREIEVSPRTLANWKKEHPDFLHALNRGRDIADGRVARSLYERATGYEHKAVKLFYDRDLGKVIEHEYTERYPPDSTAMIFWLKNRQRVTWRDRHDLSNDPDNPFIFAPEVPAAQRRAAAPMPSAQDDE
jgi:hypothetical protein